MPRRTSREVSPVEFPELAGVGLKARNVEGDGNCLFRALSDQMHGHQDLHQQIRARVSGYMKENPEDYKPFHDVEPEGGARRNEMRSTRTKRATRMPSPTEQDDSWKNYLQNMSQPGTWAGQLEIKAFAKAYNLDVKIHLDGTTHGQHDCVEANDDPKAEPRKILHVAFKNMHYQSVRNMTGPHSGPANTLPFGDLSYKERMDIYKSESTSSTSKEENGSQDNASKLPTPPTTPAAPANPLAFMDDWSDSEDEAEEKSVVKKPASPKKSTPPPSQNPVLMALFNDDSDSETSPSPPPRPTTNKKRSHEEFASSDSDSDSSTDEEMSRSARVKYAKKDIKLRTTPSTS